MQGGKYEAERRVPRKIPTESRGEGRFGPGHGRRRQAGGARRPARHGERRLWEALIEARSAQNSLKIEMQQTRVLPPSPLQHLQPAQPRRRRPLGCRIDWVPRPSTGRMDPVRPVRPRAASLPARLELAPQFLSSTFGPRSSYSGAPEAATKRQASPAPAASPAKKSSGARAWSPYHAYCKA